jgi:hypothetical protein
MKKLLVALILLGIAAPWAEETDSSSPDRKFIVGFGGGYEAGNGLQLGMRQGKNAGELGLGLLYDGQTAKFQYSLGLRYLRALYSGRVNDTYAWTGVGVMGHSSAGDNGSLVSAGAGLGLSLHFGLPFHLNCDSGWHVYRDSQGSFTGLQFGPTINGSLVYEW